MKIFDRIFKRKKQTEVPVHTLDQVFDDRDVQMSVKRMFAEERQLFERYLVESENPNWPPNGSVNREAAIQRLWHTWLARAQI